MSPIFQYFEARKTAAIVVTWAELVVFVGWIGLLVWQLFRIRLTRSGFEELQNVVPYLEREVLDGKSGRTLEDARLSFEIAMRPVDRVSKVAREHLWTLFAIGYQDLDLDTSELIRKSDEQVSVFDSPLRNTIGLFVILGLLGTLFSVADAITLISGAGKTDVHQFLRELSGAFAPSLTGVLLSIICALGYAWLQIARTRMRVLMRERTVRDWSPKLRPPVTRRLQEASKKTLDAARDVVRFAEDINRRTKAWKVAVRSSAKSAQTIASAMGAMSASLVEARTTAQSILGDMNAKLNGLNQALGEWRSIGAQIVEFKEASARAQEQQAQVALRIEQHSERLATATQELKQENNVAVAHLTEAVSNLSAPVQIAADRIEGIAAGFVRESHQAILSLALPLQMTATQLETTSTTFSASCTKITSTLAEQLNRTAENLDATHRAGWAKIETSVQDRITSLAKSASELSQVFKASIESLGQLHQGELAEVKSYFGTLSVELQLRATDIARDLSNLGDPFRKAAEEVSTAATHAERMLTQATVRLESAAQTSTADVTDLARYIRESATHQRGASDLSGPGATVQRELMSAISTLKDAADKLYRHSTPPNPSPTNADPTAGSESRAEPMRRDDRDFRTFDGHHPGRLKTTVAEPPVENTKSGWWTMRWIAWPFRRSNSRLRSKTAARESRDRLDLDGE